MRTAPPIPDPVNEYNLFEPVTNGMRLGFRTSLTLSGAYAVLAVIAEIGRQTWLTHQSQLLMLPVVRVAGMLPFGYFFAIIPAVSLGIVTGGLVGELWKHIGRRTGSLSFALLILVLCSSIVVGLHVAFSVRVELSIPPLLPLDSGWLLDGLGALVSYPFLLGVPSILYVLAGALGGYKFWRIYQHSKFMLNRIGDSC